jgi:hypothetical protein
MPSSFHKEKLFKPKNKKQQEEEEYDEEAFLNSHVYSYESDNDLFPSQRAPHLHDKSLDSSNRRLVQVDSVKELKKQRRGLAEISLKVKNIVARIKRMTFK